LDHNDGLQISSRSRSLNRHTEAAIASARSSSVQESDHSIVRPRARSELLRPIQDFAGFLGRECADHTDQGFFLCTVHHIPNSIEQSPFGSLHGFRADLACQLIELRDPHF
jgi:hypothetical protein